MPLCPVKLELLLEKIKKDREERAKFETLKKKGDMSFASGDLDEAESNYENALSIIFDNCDGAVISIPVAFFTVSKNL